MLPANQKITSAKEFTEVIQHGCFTRWKYGVLWIAKKEDLFWGCDSSLGMIVPKSVGNSVVRHTMSRYIRTIFREELSEVDFPFLLVVKLYQSANYEALSLSLLSAFYRCREKCVSVKC